VLNISMGGSRSDYYDVVLERLNQKNPDGSYQYPELRQSVLGGVDPLEDRLEEARRIAAYTDGVLDNPESAYSQAMQNYQDTTARLAAPPYNIQIVAAAGNKGSAPEGKINAKREQWERWQEVHPGSIMSDQARSPDVIAVANYDMRGPGMHPTSGRGSGRENGPGQPTMIAAPGNGTHNPQNPSTSAAAPYVSGTIALMLQANPNLTPAQIREILEVTSNPIPNVDATARRTARADGGGPALAADGGGRMSDGGLPGAQAFPPSDNGHPPSFLP